MNLAKLGMPLKWLVYKLTMINVVTNPDRLYIEATNECNLKCVMCPKGRGEMERKVGFIEFELFKSIIDEMHNKVKTAVLHIWGEPLMHPNIFKMIDYCAKMGLRSEISTNATLLSEELTDSILKSKLSAIYLCLDGVKKETYESVRVGSDFEATEQNIQRFIDEKVKRGANTPYTNIQVVEMKATASEISAFKEKWNVPGVDHINVKAFDSWGGQIDAISELGSKAKGSRAKGAIERYHCPNLWYHVHIYHDGTLVCCDRDYDANYPLGNVKDGVMKTWNGERMRKLRQKHIDDDLSDVPSCDKCTEWAWWKPSLFSSRGNIPE